MQKGMGLKSLTCQSVESLNEIEKNENIMMLLYGLLNNRGTFSKIVLTAKMHIIYETELDMQS